MCDIRSSIKIIKKQKCVRVCAVREVQVNPFRYDILGSLCARGGMYWISFLIILWCLRVN